MRKYELIEERASFRGAVTHLRYRIRALRDFSDVKAGDLGGYMSNENSLSHEGDCWIYDNSAVLAPAQVYGNAKVYNDSVISSFSLVYGNSIIDCCDIRDSARVFGNSNIKNVDISGSAILVDFCAAYETFNDTLNENFNYYSAPRHNIRRGRWQENRTNMMKHYTFSCRIDLIKLILSYINHEIDHIIEDDIAYFKTEEDMFRFKINCLQS